MKLLYITIWPATGIWSDQPLKSEEDLHALAVRAYDRSSADVLRAAGAAAEFLGSTRQLPGQGAQTKCDPDFR